MFCTIVLNFFDRKLKQQDLSSSDPIHPLIALELGLRYSLGPSTTAQAVVTYFALLSNLLSFT